MSSPIAVGVGAAPLGILLALTHHALLAVTVGTSVTLARTGMNFGRRNARALASPPDFGDKSARRAAIAHTGRAAWRGMVEGFGAAAAAVVILNLPHRGILADWILPVVRAGGRPGVHHAPVDLHAQTKRFVRASRSIGTHRHTLCPGRRFSRTAR